MVTADTNRDDAAGTLVLVVGPSGAGKDSLIAAARETFDGDPRFVFPRRIVTRASSRWEDHDSLTPEAFAAAAAAGRFALIWSAHGLDYAIGRDLIEALGAGRIVVCNVSRTVVAEARARFPALHVVLVDAAPEVLTARLKARSREPESDSRTGRGRPAFTVRDCDTYIDNSGALADAEASFIATLTAIAASPVTAD